MSPGGPEQEKVGTGDGETRQGRSGSPRRGKNQKGTVVVCLMAALPSNQLTSCLKGSSCSPCSNRVLWFDDAAETWKIAVRTKMLKYLAKPQAAIGQDNSKLTFNTLGETKKKVKQALWRAKKLIAELRPKKGVGGDSDDIAGGDSDDGDVSNLPVAVAHSKEARQWILDSGSCFDIAGRSSLSPEDVTRTKKSDRYVTLQTASGIVRENRRVQLPVGKINKVIDAVVLDGCPNVLSLGQRCLLEGYSLRWDAGMHPVLTARTV